MKKTILGLGLVIGVVTIVGCGGSATTDTGNATDTTNINGGQQVTKQQISDVQQKLQEVKAEVLKVQMDKTLTKEQKATKIETLQAEIKKMTDAK